jgi:hypothetical protein
MMVITLDSKLSQLHVSEFAVVLFLTSTQNELQMHTYRLW